MGRDVLHGQRLAGVMKELTVFALVYISVRVVRLEAASWQGGALERISFVDAFGGSAPLAGGTLPRGGQSSPPGTASSPAPHTAGPSRTRSSCNRVE